MTTASRLHWINRLNMSYGFVGGLLMMEFSSQGSWKSFLAGWTVSVVNFWFLKRLGTLLTANADKVSPVVYGLLVGKFAFWGLVIALLVMTNGIQAIPFVVGMLTILAAALGLGVREIYYARA